MADAENAKPTEDDAALLAVEATEPVVLQEPDRSADTGDTGVVAKPAPPAKQKSGLLGFVLGGALLAGGGFAAARYALPDTGSADAIAALQAKLDAQIAGEAVLRSDIDALAARPAPDATVSDRLATLESAVAEVSAMAAQLTGLQDRLAGIEAASGSGDGPPAAVLAAIGREMKALQAQIDAQKGAAPAIAADVAAASDAAEARIVAAELAAETAAKQAALSHFSAAFESGAPLGPALDGLKALGADIPPALTAAMDGVPTLLSLQEGFAESARAALDASIRADMGNGWASRMTSFLRTQTGARSLTPQEGPDPDAVLSRAEAALKNGQIKETLAELAGLPPEGSDAMSTWVADATRRMDTEQAISELSATLNGQ